MSFSSTSNVLILIILLFSFNIVFAKDVLVNEIAWMGTENSANDEWIELYNTSDKNISLENYKIIIGKKEIELKGIIKANSFYILERTDDTTLSKIKADLIFTGSIKNTGEKIILKDDKNNIIDVADFETGWTVGDNKTKQTAERIDNSWQTSSNKGGSPNQINIKIVTTSTTIPETNNSSKLYISSTEEIKKENHNYPLKTMFAISLFSAGTLVFIRRQLSEVG